MEYESTKESFASTRQWIDRTEIGEGARLAQALFLDELPGAMFVFMTLMWVVSTFAGLFF